MLAQVLTEALDDRWREVAAQVALQPRVVEQLGLEPVFDGPEAFRKFIAADVEKNAALLKGANYQPE